MAISSVKVKINGVWTNLSYNEETMGKMVNPAC